MLAYLPVLVGRLPAMLGWLAAAIVAIVLVQRSRGTGPVLFLIGAILMLAGSAGGGFGQMFVLYRRLEGMGGIGSYQVLSAVVSVANMVTDASGIICIIFGVWNIANSRSQQAGRAQTSGQDQHR